MIPSGQAAPDNIKASLDRYANNHIPVGGFLTAVLSNDLLGAFGRADPDTLLALRDIVGYCHNEIPNECWGSPGKIREWLTHCPECGERHNTGPCPDAPPLKAVILWAPSTRGGRL